MSSQYFEVMIVSAEPKWFLWFPFEPVQMLTIQQNHFQNR